MQDSTSLLLSLLAAASAAGAWTCFVGAPALGLLAAADAGCDLDRVAVVPEPGANSPQVVAALLDGMDIVVIGPQCTLLDSDRRRLMARARERGCLLAAQGQWPGAHVSLRAQAGSWAGAQAGDGWLRHRHLTVARTGRGSAAWPKTFEVEVPVCGSRPPWPTGTNPRPALRQAAKPRPDQEPAVAPTPLRLVS